MHAPKTALAIVPPAPPRRPVATTHHGTKLQDDYGWLRAQNWQEVMRDPSLLDAEIRSHLEAENAYTDAQLADTRELQATLFAEMKARIKEDDSSVPSPDGDFEYFASYVTGGQYPRVMRQLRRTGDVSIILDGNEEAAGKPYWQLGDTAHSLDHRYLAYAVDEKGSEFFTVRVRDMGTGEDLADTIPDTRGGVVWAADSRSLLYVRLDDNHRPLDVYRHRLGTSQDQDELVYAERDRGFYVGVGQTQSNRFLQIIAHDHQTTEIYLIDAERPADELRLVAPRQPGHEYQVEHHGDRLFITTNSNGAADFRICTASLSDGDMSTWSEFLPHKPGRYIIETVLYKEHLVRLEREDGLPRIVVHRLHDGAEHTITFDEEAYSLSLASGYEFDTTTIRFTYSSMTTPAQVYDYDLESRARSLRKSQEIPSGHNPAEYITRRIFAAAGDGQRVPISILYRTNTPLDGSAPLLLYGYGAYGISIPASFSATRLSLVDRGFVYAIAHVRGGKDKGHHWYEDGKGAAKMNTFTDFIAAGEHLARQGFTSRGRIVANGGSAGGMLMGVVTNLAPDLFLGIIADVPFVDVLNTMLDPSLPLTPPEWPEWGNPITSKEQFDQIRAYSPYDNVDAKAYPHIFAYGGLTDPRVTYWEPAKWIAKLREKNTGDGLVLLKTNMEAGHGGASGRFEALKEVAVDYAFALKIVGDASNSG